MFLLSTKMIFLLICLMLQKSTNMGDNNISLDDSERSVVEDNNERSENFKNLNESLNQLKELVLSADFSSLERDGPFEDSIFDEDKISEKIVKREINDKTKTWTPWQMSNSFFTKLKAFFTSIDKRKDDKYRFLRSPAAENRSERAWDLLFGVRVPQNVNAAAVLFEELADEGHPEGHTGMAFLHSTGLALARSQERALLHFTIAALGGSLWARMALGYRYRYGITVMADCEKALQYYKMVAERVVSDFKPHEATKNNKVSIEDENDLKNLEMTSRIVDIIEFYEMLAESGDPQAQFILGHLYYYGTFGLERDARKALRYFQLAEKNKILEATAFLGKIYYEGGENTEVNLEKAYKHFEKAASSENPIGEAGLGKMYLDGKYVPKDNYKAFHYLSKSAQKGWVDGLISLAQMHYRGIGIGQDFSLARKYFLTASQSGHVLAYYYLGTMHEKGLGCFRSCMTAVELYKTVAEKGKWDKLFIDAFRKFRQRRYKEAFMMYSLLAEIGYTAGEISAAALLDDYSFHLPFSDEKLQTKNDSKWLMHKKALQYWNRAAKQGDPRSLIKIGDHHYYGLGIEVNYDAASMYYTYSALRYNNAEAMYNIGYMHERGIGLAKDINLAKRYYDLALDMSDEAWLPIGLSLLKLNLFQSLTSLRQLHWSSLLIFTKFMHTAFKLWDVWIIGVLGIISFRLIRARLF